MKKLTDQKVELAKNALLECIEKTAGIDDRDALNDAAFEVLYARLGDQPELLKRACEAYNHKKTLYKLESATDDNRGESFAILDAPALYQKAQDLLRMKTLTKAASASLKPRFWADEVPAVSAIEEAVPMQKFASAEKEAFNSTADMSEREFHFHLRKELQDNADLMYKYACDLDDCRKQYRKAMSGIEVEFGTMSPAMQKKAASLICSIMGEFGDSIVSEFNRRRPMQKIASVERIQAKGTLRFPSEKIYKEAQMAKQAHDEFYRMKSAMLDFAADVTDHLKQDFMPAAGLTKQAAGFGSYLVANTVLNNMPEAFGIMDGDTQKVMKKLYTPQLQNKLRELAMKRTLYSMYRDEYIRSFPDDKIIGAVNEAIQQLPPQERVRPALNIPLLKSRVIDFLGRGGIASAGDADKILNQTKLLEAQRKYQDDINDGVLTGKKE